MLKRLLPAVGCLAWTVILTGCAGQFQLTQPSGNFQVTSSSSSVRAGDEVNFSASRSGVPVAVTWSVNGILSGNPSLGTIDNFGKYLAPASLPADNRVHITAVENNDPSASGAYTLTLLNPIPVITSVTTQAQGESLQLQINGRNFIEGARVTFGGTTYSGVITSSTRMQVNVPSAPAQAGPLALAVINPEPGAASSESTYLTLSRPCRPIRDGATVSGGRFLEQASFGPTGASMARISTLRNQVCSAQEALALYIDEQMNPSVTVPSIWPDPTPVPLLNGNPLCGTPMFCVQISWFQNALQGQDQLRQRTAFALSQIWVISGNTVLVPDSYVTYYRILNNRAFGNYYQIMDEITRSSAMGYYLDMGNSAKPATSASIANENYARELLQLFAVGLYMLNEDGTFQLDSEGQRLPAYTETDVQEFARALTGWTYQRNDNSIIFGQSFTSGNTNRRVPMITVAAQHDTGGKVLLNYPGAVSPILQAGNTAQQDLDGVLQNIFNHPNVPPFISGQLIQHLVTSNPSPEYVARISAVFKNNGSNVRGDLAAVIKAILLDPEARRGDESILANSDGHLKEPVLYITGILRSLGFVANNPATYNNNSTTNPVTMTNLGANLWIRGRDMGQNVLFSPSVFNYFTPDYSILNGTLLGPEFQLQTTANAPMRLNFADLVVRNQVGNAVDISAALSVLAAPAADPQRVVDILNQQFMHGQMSASMKQTIITTISALPSGTATERTYRAKIALYLTITSSQYQVAR